MDKMEKEYTQRRGIKETKYSLVAEGKNDDVLFGVYCAVEDNDTTKKLKQGTIYTIETKTIPELINCKDTPFNPKTFELGTEEFRKKIFSDTIAPESVLAMVTNYYKHQDIPNKFELVSLLESALDLLGIEYGNN